MTERKGMGNKGSATAEHESLGGMGTLVRRPLRAGRMRGDATTPTGELADDQLLEIVDGNGLTRWCRVSDVRENGALDLRGLSQDATRSGLGDLVTNLLEFQKTDEIAAGAVIAAVTTLEKRFYGLSRVERLPDHDDALRSTKGWAPVGPDAASGRRFALLLHGTFSSPVGSFGALASTAAWRALLRANPDGVLALTAPTMGESPIASAKTALDALPDGAQLDLVSYSRGGLIGELLARAPAKLDKALVDGLAERHKDEKDWVKHCKQINDELAEFKALRDAKSIAVVRHTRVATPLGGTPLAGKKLDVVLSVLLNAIGWIPALKASPLYGFVKRTVLEIIKRRRSFAELPGLAVMDPDSPLLRALTIRGPSGVPTQRVAGDVQGGSWLGRLAIAATDLFFGEDHDLVVPTRSSFVDVPAPLESDVVIRGPEVNHWAYFSDERVHRAVSRVRGVSEDAPRGEAVVVLDAIGATPLWRDPPTRPDADVVFYLPGILGTELWERTGGNARRIWPDLGAIARGGLKALRIGPADGIEARNPLVSVYQGLATRLGERFDVKTHGYDWRLPIEDLARQLTDAVQRVSDGRKIHFVCHSMGGLVVLEMLRQQQPALLPPERRGRVVLMGTPTWGAAKPLLALGKADDLVKKLALADLSQGIDQITDVLRSLPGLFQMTYREAPTHGSWSSILSAIGMPGQPATHQSVLDRSIRYWKNRDDAWNDSRSAARAALPEIVYVAGVGHETADTVTLDGTDVDAVVRDEVRGDGTVTWARGFDARFMRRRYWVDATHAVIPREIDARAVIELVETGETSRLLSEAPPRRFWDFLVRAEGAVPQEIAEPRRLPTEDELAGATPPRSLSIRAAADEVECGVVHGSLDVERDPVVLMVFEGESLTTQAHVLDRVLRGELRRAYDLGIWPRGEGSHRVVRALDARDLDGDPAREVVLVNVGAQWALTRRRLREALTSAMRAYIYGRCESDQRDAPTTLVAGILGVDGRERIGVEEAVATWVEAAVLANRALRRKEVPGAVGRLRFVEPYRDIAARAAHALRSIETWLALRLRAGEFRLHEGMRVKEGYFGAAPSSLGAWETWDRVSITGADGGADLVLRMRYGTGGAARFGSRAWVSRRLVASARREGRAVVHDIDALGAQLRAITTTAQRDHLTSGSGLVLEVDARAAAIPWEALLSQTQEGELEARDALVRVRLGERQVLDKRSATHNSVLLLGAPGTSEEPPMRLPAAAAEVVALRGLFEEGLTHRWSVRGGAGMSSDDVLITLTAQSYRVLHIASHGRLAPNDRTEVYIGDGRWRGPELIDQLEALPQFVFLNCCHLGQPLADPAAFAANLAEGFLSRGVRAMVVAGWEVADNAARTFAEVFYTELLGGETFGRAVRIARRETRARHPNVSSWAAFHCYGEPGFVLVPEARLERRLSARAVGCADPQEAIDLLIALHGDARVLGDDRRGELRDALTRNLDAWPAHVRDVGEVLERAALLRLDLGDLDGALLLYQRLLPSLVGADAPPGPRSMGARGTEWAVTTLSRVARRDGDAAMADRAMTLITALCTLWPSDPALANVSGHVLLRRTSRGPDETRSADLDKVQSYFDTAASAPSQGDFRARHALDAAWLQLARTGDVRDDDRVRLSEVSLLRGETGDTFSQRSRAEIHLLRYALAWTRADESPEAYLARGLELLRTLLTRSAARMWRDVLREFFEVLNVIASTQRKGSDPLFVRLIETLR